MFKEASSNGYSVTENEFIQLIKDKKYYIETPLFLFGSRGDYRFKDDLYDSPNKYGYGDLVTTSKVSHHNFIIPGISNCALETYVDNRDLAMRYVENVEFKESDH